MAEPLSLTIFEHAWYIGDHISAIIYGMAVWMLTQKHNLLICLLSDYCRCQHHSVLHDYASSDYGTNPGITFKEIFSCHVQHNHDYSVDFCCLYHWNLGRTDVDNVPKRTRRCSGLHCDTDSLMVSDAWERLFCRNGSHHRCFHGMQSQRLSKSWDVELFRFNLRKLYRLYVIYSSNYRAVIIPFAIWLPALSEYYCD